jgi:hypothetical protein
VTLHNTGEVTDVSPILTVVIESSTERYRQRAGGSRGPVFALEGVATSIVMFSGSQGGRGLVTVKIKGVLTRARQWTILLAVTSTHDANGIQDQPLRSML